VHGRITSKLTSANVLATVAVFIALGGGAYAATNLPANSVTSRNIVDGQVKQKDLGSHLSVSHANLAKQSTHAVRADQATSATNATTADSATDADHATSADTATSATNATNAANAANAAQLGGQDASAYAPAGTEAVQPATLNDTAPHHICYWTNYGGGQTDAGYYRDRAGVVHLQGLVVAHDGTLNACGDSPFDVTITYLPAGYRPANLNALATVSNDKPGRVNVRGTDGEVSIEPSFPTFTDAKVWVSLDGLSFRCAPSGQNGCP
jgi:hypothetical protein